MSLLALVACRDRHAGVGAKKSPLETGIAQQLTARFGTPVTVSCKVIMGVDTRCSVSLSDGTQIPVAITTDRTGWDWRVTGTVLEQAALTEYVAGALADLHVDQKVDCSPAVHVLQPGDRTTCKLSGGGLAFVQIAADGSAHLELALDATAAAARGELVTPERSHELLQISRALEGRAGASDGEDEVPGDGGVEEPADDASAR